ncbi:transketolase [Enterobacter cancerogenus]|uniref:Transketolase n=1 Tax=Enterobacter cancerogenus TaxID=69218 RepID=A0A484ZA38_9ENTR|nr:transketolase [Enterobacter cancerogenus]
MNVKEVTQLARDIRLETLKALTQLGFGHYGGSMSVVETLAVLYGAVMKIDPADPDWPERDYFVLSKGHAGPALYSTLAIKGYFPIEELSTLNHNGTRLPSHPDRLKTRGVDATTARWGRGSPLLAAWRCRTSWRAGQTGSSALLAMVNSMKASAGRRSSLLPTIA